MSAGEVSYFKFSDAWCIQPIMDGELYDIGADTFAPCDGVIGRSSLYYSHDPFIEELSAMCEVGFNLSELEASKINETDRRLANGSVSVLIDSVNNPRVDGKYIATLAGLSIGLDWHKHYDTVYLHLGCRNGQTRRRDSGITVIKPLVQISPRRAA